MWCRKDKWCEFALLCQPAEIDEDVEGDAASKVPLEYWSCRDCHTWVNNNLPTKNILDLIDEKNADEQTPSEIATSMANTSDNPDAPVASPSDSSSGLPIVNELMKFGVDESVGYWIEEQYELMTYNEILQTTKSSPSALGAKAVKRRTLSGKLELRYAMPLPTKPRPTLHVFSRHEGTMHRSVNRDQPIPIRFAKHPDIAFQGVLRESGREMGYDVLNNRLSSLEDLIKRALAVKEQQEQKKEARAAKKTEADEAKPDVVDSIEVNLQGATDACMGFCIFAFFPNTMNENKSRHTHPEIPHTERRSVRAARVYFRCHARNT